MKVAFACPHCGNKLSAPQEAAGKQRTCPGCQQRLTVPVFEHPVGDSDAPASAHGVKPLCDGVSAEVSTDSACPKCGKRVPAAAERTRECPHCSIAFELPERSRPGGFAVNRDLAKRLNDEAVRVANSPSQMDAAYHKWVAVTEADPTWAVAWLNLAKYHIDRNEVAKAAEYVGQAEACAKAGTGVGNEDSQVLEQANWIRGRIALRAKQTSPADDLASRLAGIYGRPLSPKELELVQACLTIMGKSCWARQAEQSASGKVQIPPAVDAGELLLCWDMAGVMVTTQKVVWWDPKTPADGKSVLLKDLDSKQFETIETFSEHRLRFGQERTMTLRKPGIEADFVERLADFIVAASLIRRSGKTPSMTSSMLDSVHASQRYSYPLAIVRGIIASAVSCFLYCGSLERYAANEAGHRELGKDARYWADVFAKLPYKPKRSYRESIRESL